MQISTKMITFQERKLKEVLKLDNQSLEKVIYKIKSNNLEAFSIYPAKGFIQPEKFTQIQVSLKKYTNINARLLFAYGYIANQQQTNFDQAWSSIDEIDIKKEYVQVTCIIHKPKQAKIQKQITFKKTESPLYEPQLQKSNNFKSQKQESSTLSNKQKSQPVELIRKVPNSMYQTVGSTLQSHLPNTHSVQVIQKSSTNMCQTVRQLTRQTKTLTMISSKRSNAFQNQLKAQRQQNKQLKQKLTERQKKLQFYQNIAQQRINRSIVQQEPSVPLNNLNICLLIIICIFFGFFVARIPSSDPL